MPMPELQCTQSENVSIFCCHIWPITTATACAKVDATHTCWHQTGN